MSIHEEHMIASFIEISKSLGWTIEDDGISRSLVNMNRPSHHWCATWRKYKTLDGEPINVPSYMPEVVAAQIEELIKLDE